MTRAEFERPHHGDLYHTYEGHLQSVWVTEALHGQRLVIVIVIFETVIFAVRSEFGFSKYTEKKVHCNTFSAFFFPAFCFMCRTLELILVIFLRGRP